MSLFTGPKEPPGYTGLQAWLPRIRLIVPALLVGGWLWMMSHSMTIGQSAQSAQASTAGSLDASDLVASTTPPAKPTRAPQTPAPARPSPPPGPVAMTDFSGPQAVPAATAQRVAAQQPMPTVPPTIPPWVIERQRKAEVARAALAAPLVVSPISAPASMAPAVPKYYLRRGQIIDATLYTSVDSTVSGQIIAYVGDEPIYDFTHRVVLIPPHAKIIGTYGGSGSTIANGQARLPASFDEIELADRVIPIGPQPGIDRAGTNGLGATVDRHTKGALKNLLILAAVGELLNRTEQTCSGVNCAQSSGGSSVGSSVVQAGTTMLGNSGPPTPTLHIVEGAQIAVELTADIELPEWAP